MTAFDILVPVAAFAIVWGAVVLAKLIDRFQNKDTPESVTAALMCDATASMHERFDRVERLLRELEAAAAENRAMIKQMSA